MIGFILISHGIGSCWLLSTVIDDVNAELNTLNRYKKLQELRMEIHDDLVKFIEFQAKIKQLRKTKRYRAKTSPIFPFDASFFISRLLTRFSMTYRLIFTSDLLWTLSTMAVFLVCIQIELVELIALLFSVSTTIKCLHFVLHF